MPRQFFGRSVITLFYPGKQIMPTPTLILPRIFKASYSHEFERWLLEAKWCMTHTSTQILAGRPLACSHYNRVKLYMKFNCNYHVLSCNVIYEKKGNLWPLILKANWPQLKISEIVAALKSNILSLCVETKV